MTRGHLHSLALALAFGLLTTATAVGCGGHGSGTGDPDAPGGGGDDDVDASSGHVDASVDASDEPGSPAEFTANPMSIAFGSLGVGMTSTPQAVTVRNVGGTVSGPISATVMQGSFGVVMNGCSQGLRPDGTCQVLVRFQPVTAGMKTNTLTISDGAASVQVGLTGNAMQQSGAVLHLEPALQDFGTINDGTTSAVSLTLSNTGGGTSGIPNITKSGASEFAIGPSTCTAPLPPGGSCTFAVSFSPQSPGQRQGAVTASATPGGSATTTLVGNGMAVNSGGGLVFVPSSFNFGDTHIGDMSLAKQFSLVNNGMTPVGPLNIIRTGANTGDFPITGNNCANQTLSAGGSCTFFVTFEPGFLGPRSATLRATTGATTTGATADLTGNGTATAQ